MPYNIERSRSDELNDEYAELVPKDVAEATIRLDVIDAEIMTGAISERFIPKLRMEQLLQEVTALGSFFTGRYYKWKAILDNRETEGYIRIKKEVELGGGKFVSAAADRQAASEVRTVRYFVGICEGGMKRAEHYENTLKKMLYGGQQERNGA